MEFNEKLQELRKQKGLTQEELAGALFVSRTAISKWESGRGYPSIDSLKEIAGFFSVTIDELLSGDEVIVIAEQDGRQKENRIRTLVYGLMDVSCLLFLFLPLFGQKSGELVESVSLLALDNVSFALRLVYFLLVGLTVLMGILILALQDFSFNFFEKNKYCISLLLNVVGVLLFILSSNQTYAAAFLFVLLVIKALLLIKKA